MTSSDGRPEFLREAETALEDGETALQVARRYLHRASREGRLGELRGLCDDYSPGAADGVFLDHLLRNGGPATPARAATSAGAEARSLADILSDPESLEPPEVVVPRTAWRGRSALLAAREKLGKSWFASAGIGAVSVGRPFLGKPVEPGSVLLAALEEHPGDVARRLVEFDAAPERVYLLDRVTDPFGDLEREVARVEPRLVVVDTLAAFTESLGLDPGSSSDWTPVMGRLTRLARDADVALLLIHHGTKKDGSYRDSTAIGAGVDAILEMSEGAESSIRTLKCRARWKVKDYAVALVQGDERPRYDLTDGELSLDARVLMYVERRPGCSTREARENVEAKALKVTEALGRLERQGAVENRGQGGRHEWYPADAFE